MNQKPTMRTKFAAVFGVIMSIALLPTAAAHKYFFGLTEVSHNARTEHLEVVHQYTLHDVQRALKLNYGDDFQIDDSGAEEKIKAWLENHFELFDSKGNRLKLNWVGFEADFQNIWLYQEYAADTAKFCDWRVSNTMLMDAFSAQVNTINFVTPAATHGVTLTKGRSLKSVSCN